MTVSARSASLRIWKAGIAIEGTAAMIGYALLGSGVVGWYLWLRGFGAGTDPQIGPELWLVGAHFWPLVAFAATLIPLAWLAIVASRFFRDLDRPIRSYRRTAVRSFHRERLPRMDRYPTYGGVRRIR